MEEANKAYKEAIRINPENLEALLNLGALYQRPDDLDAAERQYSQVQRLNPSQAAAHANLGALFELDPGNDRACFNLGVFYESTGQNDKARVLYLRTLEINPNYQSARANLEKPVVLQVTPTASSPAAMTCFPGELNIYLNFSVPTFVGHQGGLELSWGAIWPIF